VKTSSKIGIAALLLGGGFLAYRIYKRRDISKKGMRFLEGEEGGFQYKVMKDIYGIDTIGLGHVVIKPAENYLLTKTLTKPEAEKIFNKDLDIFENAVRQAVHVPLKKHQRDALISLAFNIGVQGFTTSLLVRVINTGKATPAQIIAGFSQWWSHGDLINRRAKEARLYLTGNYSNALSAADKSKYFVSPLKIAI
jgi:lysozyme